MRAESYFCLLFRESFQNLTVRSSDYQANELVRTSTRFVYGRLNEQVELASAGGPAKAPDIGIESGRATPSSATIQRYRSIP